MEDDTGRAGQGVPSNPKERFAAMLEFLHNDELWASEYGTFVLQVSFAGPGETISFAGSVLRGAYNPAKHHSKIAQRRAEGRAYNPAKHHSKIAQRRAEGPSPQYCIWIPISMTFDGGMFR